MSDLAERVKTGIDEDRMLVLVVHVLLGFEFRAAFESGFEKLPPPAQWLKLGSGAVLMVTLALLLTVPAYHRIVEHGEDTASFADVVRRLMQVALVPFAAALGMDMAIAGYKLFGALGGATFGLLTTAAAIFFWYGIELYRKAKRNGGDNVADNSSGRTPLKDKIKQILTEARIVLPGAQALLGFQLSTFLTESFDKLPREAQLLHLAALSCVALSAILLMTPPAYHRIVEGGEDTRHFHRVANRLVVSAMVPLALGITTDFYIVAAKVTGSMALALTLAIIALVMFYGFWFAFPLLRARAR